MRVGLVGINLLFSAHAKEAWSRCHPDQFLEEWFSVVPTTQLGLKHELKQLWGFFYSFLQNISSLTAVALNLGILVLLDWYSIENLNKWDQLASRFVTFAQPTWPPLCDRLQNFAGTLQANMTPVACCRLSCTETAKMRKKLCNISHSLTGGILMRSSG